MANKKTGDNSSFEKVNGQYVSDYVSTHAQESKRTHEYKKLEDANKYLASKQEVLSREIARLENELKSQSGMSKEERESMTMDLAGRYSQQGEAGDYYARSRQKLEQKNIAIQESSYVSAQKRIRSYYSDRERASRMAGYKAQSDNYMDQREQSYGYTSDLESKRDFLQQRQQTAQDYLGSIAGRTDEKSVSRAKIVQRELSSLEEQEAKITGALNIQRKEGRDIVSQREAAFDRAGKLGRNLEKMDTVNSPEIQQQLDSLPGKNREKEIDKLTKDYVDSMKAAKEANETFASATGKSAKEMEELAKAAKSADKREETARGKLKATDEHYQEKDRSRYGRLMMASAALGGAAQLMGTTASMYEFTQVTHPAEEDSYKAQFAKIYSRQYSDMEQAALNGDVKAQRRFLESYSEGMGAGKEGYEGSDSAALWRTGASIAGGLAAIGGGAATLGRIARFTGVGTKIGLGMMALGTAGAAAGNAFKSYAEFESKTAAARGYQTRFGAKMELSDAEREIVEREQQQAMNNMRSMQQMTVGFGGAGSDLFNSMTMDASSMNQMGSRGLSFQRRNQMLQAGRQTLGKDLTRADLMAGNDMELAGYLNSGETMSALGQIKDAGGETTDLTRILREAVAAGMDDSKSIMAMVNATTALSKDMAQSYGVSTIDASQSLMSGLMQGSDPTLSTGLRMKMAENAANFMSGASTSKGFNLQNIVELGEIKQTLGKAGINGTTRELNALQTMQFSDISKISNMAPDKARKRLDKMGLGAMFEGVPDEKMMGVLNDIQKSSGKQMMFEAFGYLQNSGEQVNKISKWAAAGGDPKKLGDFGLNKRDISQARLAFGERGVNFDTFVGGYSGKGEDPAEQAKNEKIAEYQRLTERINTGRGYGVMKPGAKDKDLERMNELRSELGEDTIQRIETESAKAKQQQGGAARGAEGARDRMAQMSDVADNYEKMVAAMVEGQKKVTESLGNLPEAAGALNEAGTSLKAAGGKMGEAATKLDTAIEKIIKWNPGSGSGAPSNYFTPIPQNGGTSKAKGSGETEN